ncbi:MAG TPA: YfhO family protein [Chitinophagaceae bacterium]|jgi:hypothetical protein|nr:YfhO family protein [Chitinophagaceae bacterium]
MHLADHQHSSRFGRWKPYLFLLLIAIIAYWPISFQLFSVKNDAIHYFLPVRYQVSSSIQQGYFPYWSNSFYLGYPIHGDMQTGVWNPFVQLISVFTKYTITIFHFETLLYIFLAGAGMYKLSGIISRSVPGRLVLATAYMLCGYILGSGEFINWLASAAFIPFVLSYYYRFLHEPGLSNTLKTAVAIWLLLVCGYPADSIIMAYVLAGMCVYFFIKNRRRVGTDRALVRKYFVYHGILVIATLLLLSPALLSYFELLPYYSRGTGTGHAEAMINSFDPKSSLSFISPWSVVATDFTASGDITGRNIFPGIYMLVFAVASFFLENSKRKIILLIAAISSFLFCLGDATPFRAICYDIIPGMNVFRHPSHFRLYTILSLLLLSAITIDKLSAKEKLAEKITRLVTISGIAVMTLLILVTLFTGSGKFLHLFSAIGNREELKLFLQSLTWKDMLLVSCIIQLFFLGAFLFFTGNKRSLPWKTFLALHILNLIINSALALPATFVSKTSPAVINKLIKEQTRSYDPSSFNKMLAKNTEGASDHSSEIGLSFFYSQKPGLTKITNSPAFLASMDSFVQSDRLYDHILHKPVAWLSQRDAGLLDTVRLTDFTMDCIYSFPDKMGHSPYSSCDSLAGEATITYAAPGRFTIKAATVFPCRLNLTQAYHHRWTATVNGGAVPVEKTNIAFMSISLPKGSSEIVWRYQPGIIPYAFILSLLTLSVIIVFLVSGATRRRTTFVSPGSTK